MLDLGQESDSGITADYLLRRCCRDLAETLPVEAASIATVESRLRQWRTDGAEPDEITRIQQQASAAAMKVIERSVESSTEVQSR